MIQTDWLISDFSRKEGYYVFFLYVFFLSTRKEGYLCFFSFYLPLYGSKLGSEINMKEAQTRDVRVSSKGQGGWEKERARGGCAVQKDFLVGFVGHSLSL